MTDPTPAGPTGVPIYRPDGVRVADDYDHLWGTGTTPLHATCNVHPSGAAAGGGLAYTGSSVDGLSSFPLGGNPVRVGDPSSSGSGWIQGGGLNPSTPDRFYAMSGILIVGEPAIETVRVGSLPNLNAFLPAVTSGPVVGQTWDPIIDHASFVTGATLDFALLAGAPADLPVAGVATGNLLCDLAFHFPLTVTPGTAFSLPLPNNESLLGLTFCVQGGSIDAGTPALHFANAIDITIGSF